MPVRPREGADHYAALSIRLHLPIKPGVCPGKIWYLSEAADQLHIGRPRFRRLRRSGTVGSPANVAATA